MTENTTENIKTEEKNTQGVNENEQSGKPTVTTNDDEQTTKDVNKQDESPNGSEEVQDGSTNDEANNEIASEWNALEDIDEELHDIHMLLSDGGISVSEAEDIFKEAVETGDMSKVDIKSLEDKLGKVQAKAVVALAEKYYESILKSANEDIQLMYGIVGGKEKFDIIVDWVKSNNDNETFMTKINEIEKLINSGGIASELATKELMNMYNKDPNNSALNINITSGDTKAAPQDTVMSRTEYASAIDKAIKSGNTAELDRLRTMRRQQYSK